MPCEQIGQGRGLRGRRSLVSFAALRGGMGVLLVGRGQRSGRWRRDRWEVVGSEGGQKGTSSSLGGGGAALPASRGPSEEPEDRCGLARAHRSEGAISSA